MREGRDAPTLELSAKDLADMQAFVLYEGEAER
jgi:hypothetical protein